MHRRRNWQHARSLVLRLAPIMILPILTGCLMFDKPMLSSRGQTWYRIDPTTLPQALEQGRSDIFAPTSTRTFTDLLDSSPVQWGQADFLRIAEALPQQELSESLYDWKFSQLWFALSCEDAAFGPQQATVELYKETPRNGALLLIQRHVSILPRKIQAGWTEDELSPVLGYQPSIELAKVKVPVEQVLRIAEAQGGQAAREAVQNQCVIYLLLTACRAKNGWEVTYSGLPTQGDLYKIYVNEQTGRYQK
jgi:hypothetical protein